MGRVMKIIQWLFIILLIAGFGCLVYMNEYNKAISLYGGAHKGHGQNCVFMDSKFTIHKYHIRGKDRHFGIHGCPVFTTVR